MMTTEQLVKAFQEMRRGPGITVAKLQNRPDLLAEFNIETGAEFISFLEEATIPVMNEPKCKAALVALAIGHDPMKDLRARRLAALGNPTKYEGDVEQNRRRHEDEGFREIALLLLDSGRKRMDERPLYDRVEALEDAVLELTRITWSLLHSTSLEEKYVDEYRDRIGHLRRTLKASPPRDLIPLIGNSLEIADPLVMPSNESQPDQD